MTKIKGDKWNRRFCKWMASLLTTIFLVNQIGFSVLAKEITEEVCRCDIRCSADSVNEACRVCVEDYGKCGAAEAGTDTGTDEEPENPSAGDTDTDTGAVPDIVADEDVEEDVNADVDTNVVSDMGTEDERESIISSQYDGVENAIGEDADTFDDGEFTYKILNDQQVEVKYVDGRGPSVSGPLAIPSTVWNGTNQYEVVSIGEDAFRNCSNLDGITLPAGVTSIGYSAFNNCSSLSSIILPAGVTKIEGFAFYGCSSLGSITIPNGVTSISMFAFYGCSSLSSITIPNGVTKIERGAISVCSSLGSITIPDSVTRIEKDAFNNCSNLMKVKILNENISIMSGAFLACRSLTNLEIAVSDNISAIPSVETNSFDRYPDDRSLTFLMKDGITKLTDTTTPKLEDVVNAYDAADGIDNDNTWYGWKLLPETPDIPDVPDEEIFTITASASTGGNVSPSEAKVKSGDAQRFIITPEDGYRITLILVDGVEQLSNTQTAAYAKAGITDAENNAKYYDFENVTDDHTLEAYFEVIQDGDGDSGTGDGDDSGSGGTGIGGNSGTGSNGGDTGGSSDSGSTDVDTDSSDGSGNTISVISSDMSVASDASVVKTGGATLASQGKEPKTGDTFHMEIYATIAMIAGLSYILLYFADGKSGMTEDEMKEIVAALANWAKKGSRVKKYAALAVIFLVLVYYHSIGKRTSADWKEVYAK